MEGLVKVACLIAAVIGGLILLVGISAWMQGGFSFWPADTLPPLPTATPVPPGYVYEPQVSIDGRFAPELQEFAWYQLNVHGSELDPSVEYKVSLQARTDKVENPGENAIGFNASCLRTTWSGAFNPQSRGDPTRDSHRWIRLYACRSGGSGSITAELSSEDVVLDTHTEHFHVRSRDP